jgi:multidrug efflux pump subunit AcrA (membrane-fusion protein)
MGLTKHARNEVMRSLICLSLVILLLSACGAEVVEPVERVRAVKTILVAERASGQMRKFPGAVEAVDNSSLSFEVSGLVQEIRADVGDRFEAGQVLAVVDKKPFELNVDSARAALSRAEAQFAEKETAYDRERRIQAQDAGATTQRAVDQARAAYESLREARHVEAFEEVNRGMPVFDVFIEGAMQATVAIPETMIGEVYIGLRGEARLPNRVYQAVVSEVGSAATAANAFPVKATIIDADEEVRPGMTAELSLLFALGEEGQSGYLVPIQALAPGLARDDRHVFVYDPETSTVRKTAVQSSGLVGNQAIITSGIGPGDVIVVAGVPFLRDGQPVTLLNPSHGG